MLLFNITRQYYLGTCYLLFQHLLSYTITEHLESWTIGFCLSIKLLLRNVGNVQVDTNRIAFIPTSIKIIQIDLKLKWRTHRHTHTHTHTDVERPTDGYRMVVPWGYFLFLDAFAKLRQEAISFVMSVSLSVHPFCRIELGSPWTGFREIWYLSVFLKPVAEKRLIKICQEKRVLYIETNLYLWHFA